MGAKDWKRLIDSFNNAVFLSRERGRDGSVYVFSATPFAAKGIWKEAREEYPMNVVEMNIRKKLGYGNIYEIYVIMGNKEDF